ncbi:MarR family winged helix-turn-helix transcriptional regulator [Shewanella sp. SR44-3]|uniref:MarR family winged helix-turn-helix transcriptional regulator n=1 Tax=unclassified Shewanella TaxID=196818 RepID=UPI0015FD9295|nr:MarR family transcriptional regulator [Shewanella sp. SR44-3]MBB1269623.1 MarR family transcriptional regulator [Shewanella sp. SR44-3]
MSDKPFNPLLLENQLCFSLYATSLAMTQLYKPLLDKLGLTYTQYLIMMVLWEKDGLKLNEIGEQLGQKSGALTPVIKRLTADGLISRERCPNDDRQLKISLTPMGLSLKKQAFEVNKCMVDNCMTDRSELLSLKNQLDELRSKLLR